MNSEEAARLCAQRKHNQFMVYGKKYRYIEVFQCCGDDMNMVLNGGLQTQIPVHHIANAAQIPQNPNKSSSLLSPGMLKTPQPPTQQTLGQIPSIQSSNSNLQLLTHPTSASSPYLLSPPPHHQQLLHPAHAHLTQNSLALAGGNHHGASMGYPFSIPPPNSALIAQQQAHFIAQQALLARQQAAAAHVGEQQHPGGWAHFMNPYLQIQQHHNPFAAAQGHHHPQSPFVFMQRPFLPMAVITPQHYPTATATSTSHSQNVAVSQSAIKRSYDNAFQTDSNIVTTPKRTLTNVYNYYNNGV